jgi:hypothetical protein
MHSNRRKLPVAGALAAVTMIAATSAATGAAGYLAYNWVNDDAAPGGAVSEWRANIGEPAQSGDPQNTGLLLVKRTKSAVDVASGVEIKGAANEPVTQLGFDIRRTSYCTYSPAWTVHLPSGPIGLRCDQGARTDIPNRPNWVRVRFDASNAPQVPWGSTPVDELDINMIDGKDHNPSGKQAQSYLDNLDVNGTLIGTGKPTPAGG